MGKCGRIWASFGISILVPRQRFDRNGKRSDLRGTLTHSKHRPGVDVEQVLEGTGATDDVSLRYLRNMTHAKGSEQREHPANSPRCSLASYKWRSRVCMSAR